MNVSIPRVKVNVVFEAGGVSHVSPVVTSRGALNDGNCRSTITVGKGPGARNALPHTVNIDVFKCGKTIFLH